MNTTTPLGIKLIRLAIASAFLLAVTTATRADSPKILQIDEEWELHIGEPDAELSAPQATMIMSPHEDLDGQYFLFTVNYHGSTGDEAGGMQAQLWNANAATETATGSAVGTLSQAHDVIRWTQRMKVDGGNLTFEVVDGTSDSWGNFGGDESLKLSTRTAQDSLNDYRPAISLTESQVNYAGNRVVSLVLKKLVWLTDDGQTHELHAPIDIDADLDP